eukprot:6150032-Amphidinium_carterae.1
MTQHMLPMQCDVLFINVPHVSIAVWSLQVDASPSKNNVSAGYQHMQDRVRPRWRIRAEKDRARLGGIV